MDLELLDEPFSPNDIEWRVQQCGISDNGKPWAMVLAYVTNRAIMDRFDKVCGKSGWSNKFIDMPCGGVECGLSVKIGDEWVTKWDAADKTNMEGTKGGRSSAMKRAAVQWGAGRYLYNLDATFAICSLDKKNDWQKCRTKDRKVVYWQIPTLPDWAMPKQESGIRGIGGKNPDDILSNAVNAMIQCDLKTLQHLWSVYQKDLAKYPEHLIKLKEAKDIRKGELLNA